MTRASPLQASERADAARAMRAAGEQIDLAIEASHPAVAQLGTVLQRLSGCLDSLPSGDAAQQVKALRAELAQAVICLQFHDRMTQHLTHVRNYLRDSAGRIEAPDTGASPAWGQLHRDLSSRPLADGDIELF